MKKITSLLLALIMMFSLVACGGSDAETDGDGNVAMQYITIEDAKTKLEDDSYVFFDVRKAADSSAMTIPGAEAWDMDAAKEGDAEAGKATMTEATKDLDKNIIVVCYSGKRYAQATTNALAAIGYDMSKVFTLEGGFTAWSEQCADLVEYGISGTMKVVATNESYMELFKIFEEQTGVKVELLSMSSGEVLSKLRAEGGTPSADLWFGGGIDAFMGAKADGLLEQVNFSAAADLNPDYKDEENYWFSKGLTIVGFLLNNSIMEEKGMTAPATWDDLLDPQYKGEIVMSNPAISGTNYGVVNAILQTRGEEAGWEYFQKLNENIAFYGRRGSDPKNKVTADEYAIGITYLDGTIDKLVEEYDVSIVYPTDGIPYIPEGVAAFKNAENVAAAKFFIQWLYSNDENLVKLAEIDQKNSVKVIKPTLEGVELGYDMEILMKEDLSLFGAQREDILARFEPLMGDKAVQE